MGTIQIKKIKGKEYAYEFFSYWDKNLKKYRKKCIYLGKVIDKENNVFKKACEFNETKDIILNNEKKIVNFGDSYSIVEFFKSTEYYDIFTKVFKDKFDTLMSLVVYKIISSNSMQCADIWYDGNYISEMFRNANMTSQRISEFLVEIGKESVQRNFFGEYLKVFKNKKISTLVDSTGLPNHIDFPLKAWPNHNGNIEEETRLLYVIDRNTGMPTYFRYMAGNIVDVSTLNATIVNVNIKMYIFYNLIMYKIVHY